MPLDLTCPKCTNLFPITEARHPVWVQCARCEADLTAEFKKVQAPLPGQPAYELLVTPGKPAGSAPTAPAGAKALRLDDDDEGPKRKGGGMGVVVASGLVALAVALGGLGAVGYALFTNLDTSDSTASNQNRSGPGAGATGGPKGIGNNPRPSPRPNPVPGTGDPNPRPEPKRPEPKPKPKETKFNLVPAYDIPPPITPPPAAELKGDVGNFKLPGRVGQIAVGGGGRYLVMHIPEKGVLGLLDASTARFHTVTSDPGDVKLAAGRTKAVTFSEAGGKKLYTVYNLPTLEKAYEHEPKDADGKDDHFFGAVALGMGSKTDGPFLAAMFGGDVMLYEIGPDKLKLVEGASNKKPGIHTNVIRATPEGTAFATYDTPFRNPNVKLLTVSNRDWKVTNVSHTPFPSPDGQFYGNGLAVDRTGREVRISGAGSGAGSGVWFVPAVSGMNQFLKVAPTEVRVAGNPRPVKTLAVTIHANRNGANPIGGSPTYTNMPEFADMADVFGGGVNVALNEHFFLIPEAKLLVILSGKRTELVVRRTGK